MDRKFTELTAAGHLSYLSQKDQLMQKAGKTKVPLEISSKFDKALSLAGSQVSFTSPDSENLFIMLDNMLGNPDIARKTAQNLLGLKYDNPYDSEYAIRYVTLMSTLQRHSQIEGLEKELENLIRGGHEDLLITDNWFELLKQVQEVSREDFTWQEIKNAMKKKRGTLTEKEGNQCVYFAGYPAETELLINEVKPLETVMDLVHQSYTSVCYLVGSLDEIVESNVLAETRDETQKRAHQIEQDVERSFIDSMN